jgi:serine/threonine protein kinase
MEGSIKKHPTIGKYVLLKTLGTGYNSRVKLGYDPATNMYCAIKIIKYDQPSLNLKNLQKEIAVLSSLSHPNIVNLIEFMEKADYVKKNGTKYTALAIVMELVPGGELFEYVADSGRFTELVAKSYFHQLMDTVEYCHNQGITHRDLKPENLLFDENFLLKVADFGFATLISGNSGDGQLYTILGTPSYMAPEIHLKQPYGGPAVDLFASAIILFIMISGTPPFAQAEPKDPHYKLLCINRHETFWAAHSRGKPPGFYSAEFKHLMNSMLALDPSQRLSLAEVKAHPWYNGPVLDQITLKQEFIERKKKVDEELKRQKDAKNKQKEQEKLSQNNVYGGHTFAGVKPFKGRDLESEMQGAIDQAKFKSDFSLDNKREISEWDSRGPVKVHSEMDIIINPDVLLKYLVALAQGAFNDLTVSKDSYKIKGKYIGDIHRFDVCIEILKKDEQTCCIAFGRKSGDSVEFYRMIDEKFKQPINAIMSKLNNDK